MNGIQLFGVCAFLFCISLQEGNTQGLVINELQASNDNVVYDDFFEFDDWIEIHNTGGILNLAGHYLSDDLDSLDKWKFPDTNPGVTTILPGGHLLIWCDKDPEQGEDHADFSLSGEGETVYLVDTDGTSILDSIAYGQQQNDISYGRSCDGCEDWVFFDVPTPEAVNQTTQLPDYLLYINEWQIQNETTLFDEAGDYNAWVEVFNPNDFQVNLAGYAFMMDAASYVVVNDEPWLTAVEANGHIVLWLDAEPSQGANHLGLTCSVSGGNLSLLGPSGEVLDAIDWELSTTSNSSYGRSLDGSPTWIEFSVPTPRVTNSLQIIPGGPIVINEVLTWNNLDVQDNAFENEDWIELHNPSNIPVDIAGYFVSDRIDNPQKWMVPVGVPDSTIIPPGGFVLLYADDDEEQGWNHMNFKFNNAGEHAALRTPDGFTVLDSLNIPLLPADVSWGRMYDAQTPWIEFSTTTPNASNGATSIIAQPEVSSWIPYPNPIRPNSSMPFPEAGALYDIMGRLVMTWSFSSTQTMPSAEGLYIVQLASGLSARLVLEE
jgi:large repetitive protein